MKFNLPGKIKRKIAFELEIRATQKRRIISSEQFGEPVLQLKEKSVEKMFFSKIYNVSAGGTIDLSYPKIEIRKYNNAGVYAASDFVAIEEGAIWDKYFMPQWTKIIPLDKDLLKIDGQFVYIRKAKKTIQVENGFSLCGVHCTVWAHFLVQFLPKLYFLKEIQSKGGSDLTLILPPYKDAHIRDIVDTYLSQFKNIQICELQPNEVAECKVLYHINNTSFIADHSNYLNPSDIIIPGFTLDTLKNNLTRRFADQSQNIKGDKQAPFRKLYIGRSGGRNILNGAEIEEYFVSQGFEVIHPHRYSLAEKALVFSEAAVIVGPTSSGFTNVIFSKPGTKAIAFMNFQRTFDGYLGTLAKYYGVDMMYVTGNDDSDSIHSSYTIPLDKIKSAYREFIS